MTIRLGLQPQADTAGNMETSGDINLVATATVERRSAVGRRSSDSRLASTILGCLERQFNLHSPEPRMGSLRVTTPLPMSGAVVDPAQSDRSYMDQILSEEVSYPQPVINALRVFKRSHRIGSESDESRLLGMGQLAHDVSVAYTCPVPAVRMQNINGLSSGSSSYDGATHTITMRGKLSIITFLHELAHSIPVINGPSSIDCEHNCRVWSINLFKRVYPRAFARLQVTNGYMLSVPDEPMAEPETPSTANPVTISVPAISTTDSVPSEPTNEASAGDVAGILDSQFSPD